MGAKVKVVHRLVLLTIAFGVRFLSAQPYSMPEAEISQQHLQGERLFTENGLQSQKFQPESGDRQKEEATSHQRNISEPSLGVATQLNAQSAPSTLKTTEPGDQNRPQFRQTQTFENVAPANITQPKESIRTFEVNSTSKTPSNVNDERLSSVHYSKSISKEITLTYTPAEELELVTNPMSNLAAAVPQNVTLFDGERTVPTPVDNSFLIDIDPADDHTNLLESIKDQHSGDQLSKVLQQGTDEHESNELFTQNRSVIFPDKKAIVNNDIDIVTAFENFPHLNGLDLKRVKPGETKTDSQASDYFTSVIDTEPLQDESQKNSILNHNNQLDGFYQWNDIPYPEPPKQADRRHHPIKSEVNPIFSDAHDLVDLELSGHGFKRSAMNLIQSSQMPMGLKSAIVASAAIVLTSLMSFIVIFVACRWKRRRKLDHIEAYNALESNLSVVSSRKANQLVGSTDNLNVESISSRVSRSKSSQGDEGYPLATFLSTTNSTGESSYLWDVLRK